MGILPAIAHLTLNGMESWQNSQNNTEECWNGEKTLVSNWHQFMNENMYQVDGINTFCLMVVICWRKETYRSINHGVLYKMRKFYVFFLTFVEQIVFLIIFFRKWRKKYRIESFFTEVSSDRCAPSSFLYKKQLFL